MVPKPAYSRRRVLGLTGVTLTALIAGCGGPGEEEGADDPAEDPIDEEEPAEEEEEEEEPAEEEEEEEDPAEEEEEEEDEEDA
ncbi:hypothetical protein ACLI4Q_03385 [Natrialbaceae archaeon A-CW1-1]